MKQIIYISAFILLFSCNSSNNSVTTGLEGKPLPTMNFLQLDSVSYFNTKTSPREESIVLIYFSPTCPYCRTLTKNITDNISNLTMIKFCLISNSSLSDLKKYSDHFELQKYRNITVAKDYEVAFNNYFRVAGVPFLAVYNKEKLLKKVFLGPVSTDLIKDVAMN